MNPPYGTDKSVAIYYVVPILGSSEPDHAQACRYYTYTHKEGWNRKDPKQIVANSQSNYVCLVQLTEITKDGPKPDHPHPWTFEPDVRLYGAVSRTLTGNNDGPITDLSLANFTEPSSGIEQHVPDSILRPTVMIPVAPGSTRGLILIFTVLGKEGKASPGLRATFDPEIKGSTN